MIEVEGDLWTHAESHSKKYSADQIAVVVTTNGTLQGDQNVMGGGCALEARQRWPHLPQGYGYRIIDHGNRVFAFPPYYLGPGSDVTTQIPARQPYWLIMFPVKDQVWEPASPTLIRKSAAQLEQLRTALDLRKIIVPRPGCGLGGLSWVTVRRLLKEKWPHDAYEVITFPQEEQHATPSA